MSKTQILATTQERASWALVLLTLSTPAPAQNAPAPSLPGTTQGFSITPRNGQSEQQQWSDRYACHNWAKSQSGFDPTRRAGAGAAPEQAASGRDEYRRAITACLEARGYSVQYAGGAGRPEAVPAPGAAPEPGTAPPSPPSPPPPLPPPRVAPQYGASEFKYHPLTVRIDGGYTLTEGGIKSTLDDGSNMGVGLTWYPIPHFPFAIRVDGSYSRFEESAQSRGLVSAATGTNVAFGHEDVYGGDADAEIDLPMGPRAREYFFGGFGWYRERTVFKQLSYVEGVICDFYCWQGFFPVTSTVERSTSPWRKSWNAGIGFEFALEDPVSLFIEARYVRIEPYSANTAFVPIRIGLRF